MRLTESVEAILPRVLDLTNDGMKPGEVAQELGVLTATVRKILGNLPLLVRQLEQRALATQMATSLPSPPAETRARQ